MALMIKQTLLFSVLVRVTVNWPESPEHMLELVGSFDLVWELHEIVLKLTPGSVLRDHYGKCSEDHIPW